MIGSIRWWLQLVDSSTFENYAFISREILPTFEPRIHTIWEDTPMPTRIWGESFDEDDMLDMVEILSCLQPSFEDREFMIFQLSHNYTAHAPATEYFVVTKLVVAKIDGDALIARAKQLALAAEEDLLTQGKTP